MASLLRIGGGLLLVAAIMLNTAEAALMSGRGGETYTVDEKLAALVYKAGIALKKKDHQGAIAYSTEALEAKPTPAVAAAIYDIRGCAYADAKELELALRDANECIRLNPRYFGGYQTRGRVARLKGALNSAISEYNKALELNPNFPYLYNNRGVAYSEKRDEQRALQDYEEAIRRDPNLADAYANRGVSYEALRQFDKALAEYNKAISLKPIEGFFYYSRGSALAKIGRHDEALRDFGECIRREPNDPDAYFVRGLVRAAKGFYEPAAEDLQKAVELNPKDPAVLNSFAWLKATCPENSVRDGKQAVWAALEACRVTKWKEARRIDTLAAAYAEQGNFKKAVETQRRALELLNPKNSRREAMQSRLRLYQEHKPFREIVSSG